MNRLILIGNGFDLAHGLETSYHHFILDYLKNCINEALQNKFSLLPIKHDRSEYSDDLINIKADTEINIHYGHQYNSEILEKIKIDLNKANSIQELLNKNKAYKITVDYKGNTFIKSLFTECVVKNWVDIESLYYDEIKKDLKQYNKDKEHNITVSGTIGRVRQLNNQLGLLKNLLEEYLIKETSGKEEIIIPNLKDCINMQDSIYAKRPQKTVFLNFNYTNTPNRYLDINDDIINIHGELSNEKNTIIFGYGDEIDKSYSEIEDLNENDFLKHIKSFNYFKTDNYKKLLTFIYGSDDYDVFIMGHSCGLSDRTMLNTIFERKNCRQIKIFYHTLEDYTTKTFEISRHFKNKASMREKIIPLPTPPMPQLLKS